MTGIRLNPISIRNDINEQIHIDVRYPQLADSLPLVLLVHGFKAWKDWGFFPYVADKIAESGAICINFSTSLCGVPPFANDYIYSEKFARNTITQELQDINCVLDSFRKGTIDADATSYWNRETYLLGHSRGGTLSIFIAASDKSINKVITWCPIDKFVRFSKRQIEEWKKIGFIEFEDTRTGTQLRINKSYIDDYYNNAEQYNPIIRVRELSVPILFIHGKQDLTVPYRESQTLFAQVQNRDARYKLIDNTGHTFGIQHPFIQTTQALEEVLKHTIEFIKK